MNISVLGCGRWASFHAWYANHIGHNVKIWGREGSKHLEQLQTTHQNEYLSLSPDITYTNDLKLALNFADTIIISISSQQLRNLAKEIKKTDLYMQKTFILCMKGLEISTGKRLSEVFTEEIGEDCNVGVWVGPGHVQDFLKDIPNCMVISAKNTDISKHIINIFSSDLIRFYYSEDLIGTEIGAAGLLPCTVPWDRQNHRHRQNRCRYCKAGRCKSSSPCGNKPFAAASRPPGCHPRCKGFGWCPNLRFPLDRDAECRWNASGPAAGSPLCPSTQTCTSQNRCRCTRRTEKAACQCPACPR